MPYGIAASHMAGKAATDKIFGAAAAANAAKAKIGKENVVDATIGVLLDNSEKLVILPTVEKVYKSLPMTELVPYAPIAGIPDFLDKVQVAAFGDNRPEAYTKAVSTSGGSGAIHHTIWNYSEVGDTVLTTDWYWDPYSVLSDALMRKLDTFSLFDAGNKFNVKSFESKVTELLAKQNNIVILLNTPAHNPVGYSLDSAEWDQVLAVLKNAKKDKKITLFVDAAYIDFAGEKNASRAFMKKFGGLPENILVIIGYSMSKGYTVYGMRTGAMIGISASQDVINEFANVNQYLSRATWSNINRGGQHLLSAIYKDDTLQAELEKERAAYYQMIAERANLFTAEAKEAKLNMLPYIAGFFLSIPAQNPDAVCTRLHADNIFAVPLAKGVRIAVCALPSGKIKGMPTKIARAMLEADK
ncbi:MAG: aminotransferase class I/II-fold pyridoxal phosphate-dependent enzyme [Sporomusaceae bacterium]|nr:aminotransferase class I/II-fold pyridoxal phosphate-dependent enzyme [Sporomusaceae bacterium]